MAKNKSINIILSLKDNFTKPIQRTKSETKKFEREVKRVENNIKKSTRNMVSDFKKLSTELAKTTAKLTAKGIGAGAGLGFAGLVSSASVGLAEGLDYETYRVQLETATKDTQKASKLMQDAIKLANKTPFEAGELVEATAMFESLGLSADKWLGITSDMAGATGKSITQAVEAVIDAVASGETERLKEFGITKDMLSGFDNKGSLVDKEALGTSLMDIMVTRYKGGAEELSKTTKGMWSTVTGVFKNSMANIVGIMNDGTVRTGSIMDRLRNIIEKVANKFVEWQNDGTIQKIQASVDSVFSNMIKGFKFIINVVSEVVNFFQTNMPQIVQTLKIIIPVIAGIVIATKLWTLAMKVQELWTKRVIIVQGLLNAIASINPWALVLGAVIIALMLVVANFDKVKQVAMNLWTKWVEIWEGIKTKTIEVVTNLKASWDNFINGIKEGVRNFANFFVEKINWCIEKLNSLLSFKLPDFLGGAEIGVNIPTIPEFATGTSYHRGGLARINEGGRGEIVNLPNGTQVIPNSISKNLGQNVSVSVPITIQGNIYGERDLVERVGSQIAGRVKLAIGNV